MKIFRFDADAGKKIDQFGSVNLIMSRVARLDGSVHIGCMHIGPNGVVGYHQAVVRQLFLVVQGEGWVRGESPDRVPISSGFAAYWEAGEWHESGTDTGMVAIVIESQSLDPGRFMPEK